MSHPHRGAGEALRCGDRSAAVTEIRASLTALGHLEGPDENLTTGKHVALDVFDEELDHAVRAFQQHRGLLVDGVVGEATYRALNEASYRLRPPTPHNKFGAPLFGRGVAVVPARRPYPASSVRCPDVWRRRRVAAGPAAGSRLLYRPGGWTFRAPHAQR